MEKYEMIFETDCLQSLEVVIKWIMVYHMVKTHVLPTCVRFRFSLEQNIIFQNSKIAPFILGMWAYILRILIPPDLSNEIPGCRDIK